jgi:hypothetical protein
MKLKSIIVVGHRTNGLQAIAELEVPGLGLVKIEDALSAETMTRLEAEAAAALRIKLRLPLVAEAAIEPVKSQPATATTLKI